MGLIAVLFMVASVSLAATVTATDSNKEEWESYKIKYGKSYASPEEDLKRRELYFQQKVEIEALNELYHKGLASYRIGVNTFSDLTEEEMDMRKGLRMNQKTDEPTHHENIYKPKGNPLPPSVDWRLKNVVTPVKNQGNCYSCWAFGTVGSMESQHALKTGKLIPLSEEQLVDCKNDGCSPGGSDEAFTYAVKNGMESEDEYPYTAGNQTTCLYDPRKVVAKFKGYKVIEKGNEEALQDAVANIGPVAVGVFVTKSFEHYTNGTYDHPACNADILNHEVLVIGYDTDDKGQPYWLIKNSWGQQWGEKGYMKMIRGKNMCGIANEASYPLV